ncbi:2-isopropylmalate synthase [Halodesulfurarchaeum sp.]|uniref:2-isopropylmalate synthase n=1 Tax=Halodesulfurarchaeum sp. TaxID=1980530 RepID=UPI003FA52E02
MRVQTSAPPNDDVQLLDTTLRDGEQAPGVSLTAEQKVEIARALSEAGVSVIEAGSACTGPGEQRAIKRVTELELDATVTSFARGVQHDVDLAIDAGVDGINLVVPASDRHIETKVGTSKADVRQTTAELVEYAKDHDLWVEVIGEDGSRATEDFLDDLAAVSHDAGADRFAYADTVGHASPDQVAESVERLAALGPVSVHTHDDLGLALMNALAGVGAGAELVHGTVNGVGERAGNVALEEVVISLFHGYNMETVDTESLYGLSVLVADAMGLELPPNKAVSGQNAFAHESGIHTDGTLKDERMYEPYPPETVGRERRLVLGKHAGKAGVQAALEEQNVSVEDDQLEEIASRIKALGERGKRVTDTDLMAIAEDVTDVDRERQVELLDLTAASGSGTPTASVRLRVGDAERVASGTGSGPVDAAMKAVKKALGNLTFHLQEYHVDAITGGTDAVVTVEVTLSRGDRSVTATGSEADITLGSVHAIVDGLDRLLANEDGTAVPADD